MKKLVFGFIAVVVFSLAGNAQEVKFDFSKISSEGFINLKQPLVLFEFKDSEEFNHKAIEALNRLVEDSRLYVKENKN